MFQFVKSLQSAYIRHPPASRLWWTEGVADDCRMALCVLSVGLGLQHFERRTRPCSIRSRPAAIGRYSRKSTAAGARLTRPATSLPVVLLKHPDPDRRREVGLDLVQRRLPDGTMQSERRPITPFCLIRAFLRAVSAGKVLSQSDARACGLEGASRRPRLRQLADVRQSGTSDDFPAVRILYRAAGAAATSSSRPAPPTAPVVAQQSPGRITSLNLAASTAAPRAAGAARPVGTARATRSL